MGGGVGGRGRGRDRIGTIQSREIRDVIIMERWSILKNPSSFLNPPPPPPPTHLKWKLINSNRSDYSVRNSGADIERNPIRVDSRQLDSTRLSFFVVVVVVAVVVAAVGREIFQTK